MKSDKNRAPKSQNQGYAGPNTFSGNPGSPRFDF